MNFPRMIKVRQAFEGGALRDPVGSAREGLDRSGVKILRGGRIAIAVGSRGIANMAVVVRTVASWVKDQGGEPFVVPAMGSHGGATAEGQRRVLEGHGVREDAYDETLEIRVLRPDGFQEGERELLRLARRNMPRLPVDRLDVLVVDRLGKDISGCGMDTNIIGRIRIEGAPEPEEPRITNIVACDLTEASHGNAIGVGLADIITRRLFSKIDFRATYENGVTSTFLERSKIPVVAETDRQALEWALRTCGPVPASRAGIVRIRDTLHLSELYVSESILGEIADRRDVAQAGDFENILEDEDFPAF